MISQDTEGNENQSLISWPDKREERFIRTNRLRLIANLRLIVVEFVRVPGADHVSGGIELAKIGVAPERVCCKCDPDQDLTRNQQRQNAQENFLKVVSLCFGRPRSTGEI